MEITQAFRRIVTYNGILPVDEINYIRQNKEEAIPFLLDYVAKAVDESLSIREREEHYEVVIPVFLLGEFRVKEAFPIFLKYLLLDEETADTILGDLLTEGFGAIIASVMTVQDIPRIMEIVLNKSLDIFNRGVAVKSLVVLYAEGIITHAQISAYFGEILKSDLEDEDFTAFIIIDCKDVYAEEHFEYIKTLFDEGLKNQRVTDKGYFERSIHGGSAEVAIQALRQENRNLFIADTVAILSKWYCFSEKRRITQRKGKKIGVNEPCPCGSGKKYKKCCKDKEI